jgi:DNA repair photolyase
MPVIYQPTGRAGEYAEWACNVYSGCGHRCIYCYAPGATRKTRDDFEQAGPRPHFFESLEKDARRLCFTCDPYQPLEGELQHTRRTIEVLQANGINVTILTKGGRRALRDIVLLSKGDNAFATTLTFLDAEDSVKWEPGAASPESRITALYEFKLAAGVETWVSLEPVLNPAVTLDIIGATHEFVDHFKVGKLNYVGKLPPRLRAQVEDIDWGRFAADVVRALEEYGYRRCYQPHDICKGDYYIKKDLAQFLEVTR